MLERLASTFYRSIRWLAEQLFSILSTLWTAFADLAGWVIEWLAQFFANLIVAVVEVNIYVAEWVIGFLPDAPTGPTVPSYTMLEQANQYIAVSEAFALLGVWSGIFAAVGIYKFVKLVSPVSS